MFLKNFVLSLVATLVLFAGPAWAQLNVRGFLDVGSSTTDSDLALSWLGSKNKEPNMMGILGLNLSADLGRNVDFAGQIVAHEEPGFVHQPGYTISADWLFLTYRSPSGWIVRVGRQILPLFLYSETRDVGFTYYWSRLPSILYEVVPVKSFNGLMIAKNFVVGENELRFSIFGGNDTFEQVRAGGGGMNIEDRNTRGANITFAADSYKVYASYKASHPAVDQYTNTGTGTVVKTEFDLGGTESTSVGASWEGGGFTFIAEAAKAVSDSGIYDINSYYGTVAYAFHQGLFVSHLTYGSQDSAKLTTHPDIAQSMADPTGTRQTLQTVGVLGLNYRLTNSLILKLDYQRDELEFKDSQYDFNVNTYTLGASAIF